MAFILDPAEARSFAATKLLEFARATLGRTIATVKERSLRKSSSLRAMSDQAKILIVDDSADIVEFLADLLQATGYAICTASSGPEALEQIECERPDLVLLDVMMPNMTGHEVC